MTQKCVKLQIKQIASYDHSKESPGRVESEYSPGPNDWRPNDWRGPNDWRVFFIFFGSPNDWRGENNVFHYSGDFSKIV